MALQLKFDANLPHETEAVESVVKLFDGMVQVDTGFQLSNEILPNAPEVDDLADYWLEENLHDIQHRHNAQHPEAVVPVGRLEWSGCIGGILEGARGG